MLAIVARLGLLLMLMNALQAIAYGGIYSAPVVIQGNKIKQAARYPINSYRLFSTDPNGKAVAIPFQIDEINRFGDYVLDQGGDVTKKDGNGIFDLNDELAYMGDDVGAPTPPRRWDVEKPHLLFEIKHTRSAPKAEGAVYLGIYFSTPPPLANKNYVVFNPKQGEVKTSRYIYRFDQKNYLVVNGIDMVQRESAQVVPLIDSSTFYMKADLKYFLTLEVHQKDIQSFLEAYKIGPIRAIVRVTFFYRFLKINFELGMYTEVSLFSNSVLLPAVMYNPLDGSRSLNNGSGFYYGFAINENPKNYKIETNIPPYKSPTNVNSLLNFLKKDEPVQSLYWLAMSGPDRMMYFEVEPSTDMLSKRNVPSLYQEPISGKDALKRPRDKAAPLGEGPVNMGLYFDLTRFTEGEHRIAFRLFFDNRYDEKEMAMYKSLNQWQIELSRQ